MRSLPPGVRLGCGYCRRGGARLRRRSPPICRELVRTALHGHAYDGSRAARELGLGYTPVEETLRRTLDWFRGQGLVRTQPSDGAASVRSSHLQPDRMRDLFLVTAGYLIGSIPWGYCRREASARRRHPHGRQRKPRRRRTSGAYSVSRPVSLSPFWTSARASSAALLGLWAGDELTGLLAWDRRDGRPLASALHGPPQGREDRRDDRRRCARARPARLSGHRGVWVCRVSPHALHVGRVDAGRSRTASVRARLRLLSPGRGLLRQVLRSRSLLLHRANIGRLLSPGTENRFERSRPPSDSRERATNAPAPAPRGRVRRAFRRLDSGGGQSG